jgi:hypothetical protein
MAQWVRSATSNGDRPFPRSVEVFAGAGCCLDDFAHWAGPQDGGVRCDPVCGRIRVTRRVGAFNLAMRPAVRRRSYPPVGVTRAAALAALRSGERVQIRS